MVQTVLEDFIAIEADGCESSDNGTATQCSITPDEPCSGEPVEYSFDGVKIIRTLNARKENALLESPTGSGKSMALLCGVLGWLDHQKALRRVDAERFVEEERRLAADEAKLHGELGYCEAGMAGLDEDFVKLPKRAKMDKDVESLVKVSLPKIYIASRTHRQIAQLVKELDRTSYTPKFVVLGSRSHYCVNETVRKAKDINESCRETAFATGGGSCSFFNNLAKLSKQRGEDYTPDCDIEDLVRQGKKEKSCPYFVARNAIEHAEVIFAPYNYLVDPVVRSAMGIELKDDIVIVDEAHNIEDVCRESGSFEVTDDTMNTIQGELLNITKNLKDKGKHLDLLAAHECQGHVVSLLLNWLKHSMSTLGQVRRDFESSITIWQDKFIIEELTSFGISYEQVVAWSRELDKIADASNEVKKKEQLEEKEHFLSFGSCQVLKGLYSSLGNILRDGNFYLASYRMVKYQSTRVDTNGKHIVFTLGFWCLNPEVTFKSLTNVSKAVVLTSGTLSPFEHRLEAMHIIDESQTWVGCIPIGPDGTTFVGNFKTMDSFAYQDDISRAICQITKTVPAGVLVFVPSYSFLDKLVRRMQNIGVYDEIAKSKKIFLEPRQGTPKDFDKLLKNFYRVIKDRNNVVNGALLFAVYRGKISEGLDLKDDNCRAVIPIGIPYPAFKDPKVVLKREFNDRPVQGRRLLSGQQWYESQAFRALNQALGRCIRHRADWGAIVLLEQRFTNSRNVMQLSKWVRSRMNSYSQFDNAMKSLESFVERNVNMLIDFEYNAQVDYTVTQANIGLECGAQL
ncbi:hypothetical protein PSACC_02152 [Paramicrosporidium saccamoebae]|uniref:DNA 5'-3' helicase n=1 Tax=Paramicrosporidium saccamoebae TaxID=1246581 RepID=A0A2H9TJT8_9FUNG|nr:hypothetical protein PSACC_02152 [Paramicrosporidium saccamoebae]